MIYCVYPKGYSYFFNFLFMTIFSIEVYHESPDIIGRMEEVMSLAIGYKVTVADILCYPKNKIEEDFRSHIELLLFIQARKRIKARRNLSHNQKLLCSQQ